MKKNFIPSVIICMLLVVIFAQSGIASDAAAGSSADPLATKSYVDSVKELSSSEVNAVAENLIKESTATMNYVSVPANKTITFSKVGTEAILMSGSATITGNTSGYFVDTSMGTTLKRYKSIGKYRNNIFGKAGVSLKAGSGGAGMYVNGAYTIK